MGILEDIADDLAIRSLMASEESDEEKLVDEITKLLGASSQTLEEAYKTSIRVRRAELRVRTMLGDPGMLPSGGAVVVAGTSAPAQAGLPTMSNFGGAPTWPEEITLEGTHVKLVPLSVGHAEGLAEAIKDGELNKLSYTTIPEPEDVEEEIARRLTLQRKGKMLPFTLMTPDDRPAGMTTYLNIEEENARLEIGATFIRKSLQRTALNTEAKKLLLSHAFEDLDCIAVELRTDRRNRQSRSAIERLGARLDGILRAHMKMPDGSLRDSAVYSITASEWPTIKSHLEEMLAEKTDA
ncbi:GNAT family N-acetyltransferase [Aestuariibius insulae]|uniref:GNAT family N-acetyltransferase n=1 Tax=Aestuariibius insulae TaxID=2058287 RepID=UPI00398EECE1